MMLEVVGMTHMALLEECDPVVNKGDDYAEIDSACTFAYKDMPNGWYEGTDPTKRGRVLFDPPVFDYAWWADELSRFAYQLPWSEIAQEPTLYQGKPFSELLCFPENANAIGTAIAAKLAQDFAANKDAARQFGKGLGQWFYFYDTMEQAFQLGSQAGIVKLHLSKDIAGAQAQPDGDGGRTKVRMIGPKVALVLSQASATDVMTNDVVLLSHNPGDKAGNPTVTQVLFRPKPQSCVIPYYTDEQLHRMVALAAVLGCEVQWIEEPPEDTRGIEPGQIMILHDGRFDIPKIAMFAEIGSEE